MKLNLRFVLVVVFVIGFCTSSAFAISSGIPTSERTKVHQVAQLIDHRHPARVDGATKQCYLEIMNVKEQVEALAPTIPDLRIEPTH